MMRFGWLPVILLGYVIAGLSCGPTETLPGRRCRAFVKVRLAKADVLEDKLARVMVTRDGREVVYDEVVDLFQVGNGEPVRIPLEIRQGSETEPALLESSDAFQLTVGAFPSFGSVTNPPIDAYGRTGSFSCLGQADEEVPLFIGPANAFATMTIDEAHGMRTGATVSPLGTDRALIVGGRASFGTDASPVVVLYDHATGEVCSSCVSGDLPTGRVDHTATVLADGSVLIFGGREVTGLRTALAEAYRFDPRINRFTQLAVSTPARATHVAVALLNDRVAETYHGRVLMLGGCDDALCGEGAVLDNAILLNPETGEVELQITDPLLARFAATATLLISGQVLLAGGRGVDGVATDSVALINSCATCTDIAVIGAVGGCDGLGTLCAKRAGHTATVLDSGDVLLWGGAPAAGATQAEVFVASSTTLMPAATTALDTAVAPRRIRHTATRVACLIPPCPILIVGGEGPTQDLVPQSNYFTVAGMSSTSDYGGTIRLFVDAPAPALRSGHVAFGFSDGTVTFLGGEDPSTSVSVSSAAIFSHCEEMGELQCRDF